MGSTFRDARKLIQISDNLKSDWKNIYRSLSQLQSFNNDRVVLQALEKVAFQNGVFLNKDDSLILQKQFGNDFSLQEFSQEMGLHSQLVQSI